MKGGEEVKQKDRTHKTWCTATSRNSSSNAVASCEGSSGFMVPCVCFVVCGGECEKGGVKKEGRNADMLMTFLGCQTGSFLGTRKKPMCASACLVRSGHSLPHASLHTFTQYRHLYSFCLRRCPLPVSTCLRRAHASLHSHALRHQTTGLAIAS